MMTAEEIVRALAALGDVSVDDRDYSPAGACGLCDTYDHVPGDSYAHELDDPARHAVDCPWRLAREWVASRPAVPTDSEHGEEADRDG
jgi:hypothetical protein